MCGIIGYIGKNKAAPILLECLKKLEYRGYDSAGIATVSGNKLLVRKDVGKIKEVNDKVNFNVLDGFLGLAHTRWATHGKPSKENAHPHLDCDGNIALAHNGIIENYLELKEELEKKGHKFRSQTDTEVIVHLIEEHAGLGLEKAVELTAKRLKGSYAIIVVSAKEKDRIIAARNFSPLVLGFGDGEYFAASDIPAFLHKTSSTIIMQDREYAVLTKEGITLKTFEGEKIERAPTKITWTAEQAEKGGYPHFAIKEINEQPNAIAETLKCRAEIKKLAKALKGVKRFYAVACGTSYNSALTSRYLFENILNIPMQVEISSEFQESLAHVLQKKDTVIAISQSGETADTLSAVRLAKSKGAKILALTNVVGSTITREADYVIYTYAGPEISVVATKTFTTQSTALALLVAYLAKEKGIAIDLETELLRLPKLVEQTLEACEGKIEKIAEEYTKKKHAYFLGRGQSYPIAMEGALKLKEISYIHAEGFAAGELKHGPIALIEEGTPVVVLAPKDRTHAKMLGSMNEVKARGAELFVITEQGDSEISKLAKHVLELPKHERSIGHILQIVPLQLLAYYASVKLGYDPDKPRNLAKSVTVE